MKIVYKGKPYGDYVVNNNFIKEKLEDNSFFNLDYQFKLHIIKDKVLKFFNNPKDLDNYLEVFLLYFSYNLSEYDFVEYLSNKTNGLYNTLYDFPVDEIVISKVPGAKQDNEVYLWNTIINCICSNSFKIEKRKYQIEEIKELVNKGLIIPISKKNSLVQDIPENSRVCSEKSINSLFDMVNINEESKDYIINKLISKVDIETLMEIVRKNLVIIYSRLIKNYYFHECIVNNNVNFEKITSDAFNEIKEVISKHNVIALKNNLKAITTDEVDIVLETYNCGYSLSFLVRILKERSLKDYQRIFFEDKIIKYYDVITLDKLTDNLDINRVVEEIIKRTNNPEIALFCISSDNIKEKLNDNNLYELAKIIMYSNNNACMYEAQKFGVIEILNSRGKVKRL